MAAALSTVVVKDGNGVPIVGAVRSIDESGASTGPWRPVAAIVDASSIANGLSINAAGEALVIQAGQVKSVASAPTVTASAYTANNVLGGLITLANMVRSVPLSGVLQSIRARFKSVQTTALKVHLFKANPSNSTWTDKAAPNINAADVFNLIGTYTLANPDSTLGTETVYTLDGIGAGLVLGSTSLYAVVTVNSTPTPGSTSDFSLEVSILPD